MNESSEISLQILSALLDRSGQFTLGGNFGEVARILEGTEDLVFIKDDTGRYLMVNAAYARYFRRPPEALVGARDADFISNQQHVRNAAETDRLVLETGLSITYESENINGPTDPSLFQTIKCPVRDVSGQVIGVLGIGRDISAKRLIEEALRQSEARLAAAQRIAHLGSWEWNLKTNEVVWSEESYRIYGVDPATFIPNYIYIEQHIHPADIARVRAVLRKAARQGTNFREEMRIIRPTGDERHVQIEGAVTHYDTDGSPLIMTGTNFDITERKRTELALRRSEANFNYAQRVAQVGSWEWEPDTGVIQISDEAKRIIGMERDAPTHMSLDDLLSLVHPDDRDSWGSAVKATIEKNRPYDVTFRIVRADGSVSLIHSLGEMQLDAGEHRVMTGVCRDITESERIRVELAASRDEMKDLMRHLQQVQETERRRIAREIHDEFGAVFTAANISLYRLGNQLGEASPAVRELLASTKEMISNAGRALDDIVNGLHPQMLSHLGLAATMAWYIREFEQRTGIKCSHRLPAESEHIPEQLAITLFRCLQESLTNVAKHAAATRVRVELSLGERESTLHVVDDGKGVDPTLLGAANAYGIRGMSARVSQLGGNLRLLAENPHGTRITFTLPRG
ncbi:MAG: PAS domain S-box protein [Gammaproteobacteria bacterium]|nr:PAS domain S-box protein [Gammaproteobacteria bacterium]